VAWVGGSGVAVGFRFPKPGGGGDCRHHQGLLSRFLRVGASGFHCTVCSRFTVCASIRP